MTRAPRDFTHRIINSDVSLFLHNKRAVGQYRHGPIEPCCSCNGLTYPGSTAFDLPLAGRSWMDDLVQQGFDVWSVDIRGSAVPPDLRQLAQPPLANPPLLNADIATRDVSAVHFIQAHRRLVESRSLPGPVALVLSARFAIAEPGRSNDGLVCAGLALASRSAHSRKAPPGAYRSVRAMRHAATG